MSDQDVGPSRYKKVRLSDGRVVEIERAELLNVGLPKGSYEDLGGGRYEYTFTLNNSELNVIAFGGGRTPESGVDEQIVADNHKEMRQPYGWVARPSGWMKARDMNLPQQVLDLFRQTATSMEASSEHATYTLRSRRKPGVIPLILTSWKLETKLSRGPQLSEQDENTLLAAEHTNARREFVIGPAIPEGFTREDVLNMVKVKWVREYRFDFLEPLTQSGVDPQSVLETLKPSTSLENDIVECLRKVL
jgi:hypothetical protein